MSHQSALKRVLKIDSLWPQQWLTIDLRFWPQSKQPQCWLKGMTHQFNEGWIPISEHFWYFIFWHVHNFVSGMLPSGPSMKYFLGNSCKIVFILGPLFPHLPSLQACSFLATKIWCCLFDPPPGCPMKYHGRHSFAHANCKLLMTCRANWADAQLS